MPATIPTSRMDEAWWRWRHEQKSQELRSRPIDLLFLGDSIIQNFEQSDPIGRKNFVPIWRHFYHDRNAINLGFNGDTTANLLWRIENAEVAGLAPKVALILIGTNNIDKPRHWSPEDTAAGIDAITRSLRDRLANMKLLLLALLPSDRSPAITDATLAINRTLAARYAPAEGNVTYIDVGGVFMRNGGVDADLYLEKSAPFHPSARGQAKMAAAIEPTLAALLGDRAR